MHQVAQEAKRTIAALSPTYLNSAFGGAGWRAAFAGDPTGEQGLLLPVRVGKVDPVGCTNVFMQLAGTRARDHRGDHVGGLGTADPCQ
jgi:hypothetical protein